MVLDLDGAVIVVVVVGLVEVAREAVEGRYRS